VNEDEAWDEAERQNAELGSRRDSRRYAVATQAPDGSWSVITTTDDPPRAKWKGVREWVRSWTSLLDDPTPREGDPLTFDEAVERTRSADVRTRRAATDNIARLFPDRAESAVRERLLDEDATVRSIALGRLSKLVGREGWLTYSRYLQDPDTTVASSAWRAMRKASGRGDIAEILDLAETAHPKIRSGMRARAGYLDTKDSK
jgi:HEAT repeat protein